MTNAVAPFGPVGLPDLAEHLLDLVLDRGVERQLHAGARDRALRVADLDRLAERVLDEPALAVRARAAGRPAAYSRPDRPLPSVPTAPSTCEASEPRG